MIVDTYAKQKITVSVYLKRDTHDNGMTLKEYADAVIAGTQTILTHDEFYDQFSVTNQNENIVKTWATNNNLIIENFHPGAALMQITGTAEQFNQLFSIKLRTIIDTTTQTAVRTHNGGIVIPNEIINSVDHIIGLDNSVKLKHNAVSVNSNISPDASSVPLTPAQVAKAYNLPSSDGYGACIAIVELGGGFTTQNLNSSFTRIGINTNPNIFAISVDGVTNTPEYSNSLEVMLDIYVIGGAAPNANIPVYFAPNTLQGFVDVFSAAVNDTVNMPTVISCSWGANELYFSGYNTLFDAVFQQAISLGISIFNASGDYGSEAYNGDSAYSVQYPATSPYAISVGGTTLQLNINNSIANEYAWNQGNGSSAGGVSTIYSRPSWQTGLTSRKYISGVAQTPVALTGRGIPDVAGNADPNTGYVFYYSPSNNITLSGGTSAAAPFWAAMVGIINAISGKRLGFLGIGKLYSSPSIFNDIIVGNNAAPNSSGYITTTGWDAVTGLGSPIGSAIYGLLRTGEVFPKNNFGFRNIKSSQLTYPRRNAGTRTD